jgi:hypothetical protein
VRIQSTRANSTQWRQRLVTVLTALFGVHPLRGSAYNSGGTGTSVLPFQPVIRDEYDYFTRLTSKVADVFLDPTLADGEGKYSFNPLAGNIHLSGARLNAILETDIFGTPPAGWTQPWNPTPKTRGRSTGYVDDVLELAWALLTDMLMDPAGMGATAWGTGGARKIVFRRENFASNDRKTTGMMVLISGLAYGNFSGGDGTPDGRWTGVSPFTFARADSYRYPTSGGPMVFLARENDLKIQEATPSETILFDDYGVGDVKPLIVLRTRA